MYYSCSTLILLVHHTYYSPYCRHCILYLLRLDPLFPIVVQILKPKVGLGPNQIEIDLRKVFLGKYNSFMNQISYFWKRNATKTQACVHIHMYARMLQTCVHMRMHTRAYVCMLGFQKLWKTSFLHLKLGLERIPHRLGVVPNPYFLTIKSHTWYLFNTQRKS